MHNRQLVSGLVALIVGSLAGCSKTEKAPEPVVSVQVAAVRQGSIEKVVTADAVLFPLQQAAITPKISAPVRKFFVKRGSRVKKGELLARLESRDLAASAEESKGSLAQAEATFASTTGAGVPEEMRKAELDAESTKQAFDAEQKLFDSRQNLYQQGALPRKDLDQARVSLTQAKSQYEVAEQHWRALQAIGKEQELKSATGQLASAKGKYQGAQAQLSYSEIRSPINGVIAERNLYPGEMAAAGTALIVVMDTSAIIAKAHIPQQDAALLKIGDPAQLSVPGLDDKMEAKVTVVSPATDPNSTTVEIWAQASNEKSQLRPGTSAQLSITARKIDDALIVPEAAIVPQAEGGGGTAVMVAGSDQRAHLQAVQVGVRNGDEVQIVSGVQANQKVVISGAYGIPDNTLVKIEQPAEPAKDEGEKDAEPAKDKGGKEKE